MGTWNELSTELSQAIGEAGKSVVTVQPSVGRTVSGVVIDDRTVVTAARAVPEPGQIRVWTAPDKQVNASLVGSDFATDLALLKTEGQIAPPATFLQDPALKVGQLVLAIGRTWRGNLVASSGILSGIMGEWHTVRGRKIEAFIRPDLNLYPGFSGGALIGADRMVIGMNTGGLRRGSPLTVPFATIKRIAAVLNEKGYIPRPYLGMGLQPVRVPESLKRRLNLIHDVGALVVHVQSESPADKAGMLLGDMLLSVEDQSFDDREAAAVVFRLKPDQNARIVGIRGGQQFSATVVVGESARSQA